MIALQNENHEEGNKCIPYTAYQKNQHKRAKPQSQLSRRVKFSNNWLFRHSRPVTVARAMAMQQNRLPQSKFVCQACEYTANADVNDFSGDVRRAGLWWGGCPDA